MKNPILFLIFNRFNTTQKVFEVIRKYKPNKLYIASDGPRQSIHDEDKIILNLREKMLDSINWPCDVRTLFRNENLGCKKSVSAALDWFFKNEEQGIILEDDCLPNESFFRFCNELLEKYKNNEKIAMISGNNFNINKIREADYYFKRIPHIWGWASWRRVWKNYDIKMSDYPDFKKNKRIKGLWSEKKVQNYYIDIFDKVYDNKINTWDYQLTYSIFKNNRLCICPNKNLVSNIGFISNSTHTSVKNKKISNLPTEEINFPLCHPRRVEYDYLNDKYVNDIYTKNYILKRIMNFLKITKLIKYALYHLQKQRT